MPQFVVKPVVQSCSHNQELSVVNDKEMGTLTCEFNGDDNFWLLSAWTWR